MKVLAGIRSAAERDAGVLNVWFTRDVRLGESLS